MTDHQKVLLELTKTVQLQTKLLEAQIKQCLPPSSTDVSTTSSKVGSDMKPRSKCDVLSAHSTSSTGSSSGTSGIGTSKQVRKKSVLEYPKNNVMTTVPFKHAIQPEPASSRCHKSASKKRSINELDLSVDSGIVPELTSSNDKHGHEVEKEEDVFLDKNGNITTRKIERAKTVAKVESWLKGILTPADRDCKAKQKKVTFEEPKRSLNGKSHNECSGESGNESQEENRADSTTELCAEDNETDKKVSKTQNIASDGGTFLGTSLPYPFPTLSNKSNGIGIPDVSLDSASPVTVSGSDTCLCDSTKGGMSNSRTSFDVKKFPCPINWQTFLGGSSTVKPDGTVQGPPIPVQSKEYSLADIVHMKGIDKHNSNFNHLCGNVSVSSYPRLAPPICPTPVFPPPLPPISHLPLSPFFQPPLPPEDKPPPPPPPDNSPGVKIKRRKQKSSKKKKKIAAPLEFTLQMNDPVGKVILEMSRHKMVQEQHKQEIPSQFIQQDVVPNFPQFRPHMPPHVIQNMQSQVPTHVRPPVHAPLWALNNNVTNRIQPPECKIQSDPWQMQNCEEQMHTHLPSRPTASQAIQPQCHVSVKENLHRPISLRGCESVWARLMHEAGYNSADIDSMTSLQGNWKNYNENVNKNIQYIHSPRRKSDYQNSDTHDANSTMEIDGRTPWKNCQREKSNSEIPTKRLRPFSSQGFNSLTSSISCKLEQTSKLMNSKFRMKSYPPSLLDLDPYWAQRTNNDSQECKGYKVNDFDMSLDEDLQEFFANQNLTVADSTVPLQSQTNYSNDTIHARPTAKGAIKVSHCIEKGKVHTPSSHKLLGTMHVSNNCSLPQPLCDQRLPLTATINIPNTQPAPPGVDDWNI